MRYLVKLDTLTLADHGLVGGKNASLGEMLRNLAAKGIHVPNGFATTTAMYDRFITENNLRQLILDYLAKLDVNNIQTLNQASTQIQKNIRAATFAPDLIKAVSDAYAELKNVPVAVRSSATTEDLATASFAGQQETFLNIKGINNVLDAIKRVFASLYTSRAIAYRFHQGFNLDEVSISAGIQPMIRSDKGASGVMFTVDTESGFDQVILISASYGLGEAIVQGQVNPDEFFISKQSLAQNKSAILQRRLGEKALKVVYTNGTKPSDSIKTVTVSKKERNLFCLNDAEIHLLAKQALIIENHYGKPMDIEWAKDGLTGEFFILQARPETVTNAKVNNPVLENYELTTKGNVLVSGQSIGQKISSGMARVILDPKDMHQVQAGEVIVTDMTDPDWEPVIKKAAAIVTNRGGRTCHAAIIARELGIPAIVGCNNATKLIKSGQLITVSCADGQTGQIYEGQLSHKVNRIAVDQLQALPIKLCLNVGNPERAFALQSLPNDGVGLARLEFIINAIGIHPKALLEMNALPKALQQTILSKTCAYSNPVEFYIEKLREGIATIAAAFYPKQVIFRFSDFKSNEYKNLLGGYLFEPTEENPMLGFRGASRYKSPLFRDCFALECQAFKRVHDEMGLTNAQVMLPFVRTVTEMDEVIKLMEDYGLKRGVNDLKIFMMCEIPSNALLAEQFLEHIDGMSIGSNDLTQLTLGLDRDSSLVADQFDETDEAVKTLIRLAIRECLKQGKYVGICGQGPSDNLDFAKWLMSEGIQSISLSDDTIIKTWVQLSDPDAAVSGAGEPQPALT